VIDLREDWKSQIDGIDFGIKKDSWHNTYYLDSKGNLNDMIFYLELSKNSEPGWFWKSKSDRIYHVDVKNNRAAWYSLPEMRYAISRLGLPLDRELVKIKANDIIYKNVIIPLQIEYDLNKSNHKPPNTIIFKNRWYNQSALFTKFTDNDKDFIIKDKNSKYVDILNIDLFYEKIKTINNQIIEFEGSAFSINDQFKDYIQRLMQIKRYNLRTNNHITNETEFDRELYDKYLTHQPYEDCKSLEIDKIVETKIGSLIYWDRVRIHSSDNFMKNNVKSKTLLAFFTSKTKID